MQKHLTVVRGFVGSGKSTTATKLSDGAAHVVTIDDYLNAPPGGDDIYTSMEVARACALLSLNVSKLLKEGASSIVVDTLAPRLWEIRDLFRLAEENGYSTKVVEGQAPWAKDPHECNKHTKYPLKDTSWKWLTTVWETPATPDKIKSSISPEEKLQQAYWVASTLDSVAAAERPRRERFLLDNWGDQIPELIKKGFLGESAPIVRRSFRRQMEVSGIKPPALTVIATPENSIDVLRRKFDPGLDKTGPDASPDI